MPLQVRRIITGHRPDGKATVLIDEIMPTVSRRGDSEAATVWATSSFPISNESSDDAALGASLWDNGTVFRLASHAAGTDIRMHRTNTIDYLMVVSGEIDMEMDDGSAVHLTPGDTIVQRGTAHRWINRGTVPCVLAFVMIQSVPVDGVRLLEPLGND